jgi:DNA-binding beta-propeller fold protein YncE
MGVIARVVVIATSLVTGMALTSEAAHLILSVSDGKTSRTSRPSHATAAADVLSVLDASAFPPRIVAEIPVRHGALGPPTGVALTPDERLALVSMPTAREGSGQNAKIVPHSYLQVIDLDVTPPVETKIALVSPPVGVSVNRAGDLALVAHLDGLVSVVRIAGKTVTAVGTVKVGDARSELCHVAISPEGRWALATKRAEGTVAVLEFDGDTLRYTGQDVAAGARPCMAEIAGNGMVGVVADVGRRQGDVGAVTLIDMTRAPLRAAATVPVGATPEGVAISPDGRSLVLTVANGAAAPASRPVRGATGKVVLFRLARLDARRVAEADAGHDVRGVTFTPDGKYVLVQNAADEDLAVYSVSPTAIADTGVRLKVKGSPVSIRIAPR